jgi:hypothetical protein
MRQNKEIKQSKIILNLITLFGVENMPYGRFWIGKSQSFGT